MVASYRGSDAEAKELFVNHQAGLNGTQTSLPLDATILRDRENSALWAQAADGSSHIRAYYVQNYLGGRGDVVAILSSSGSVSQQVRYSAYGVPHGMPAGDTDFNGSIVGTPDITQMLAWTSGPYTVRGDYDLDGDVDNADVTIASGNFGIALGWNALSTGPNQSLTGVLGGHRKGYCGYEHDGTNPKIMHVRHRVYLADLGRWTRRDPLGYVDGVNLYGYVGAQSYTNVDSMGLARILPIDVQGGIPICPPNTNWNGTFCMPLTCIVTEAIVPPGGELIAALRSGPSCTSCGPGNSTPAGGTVVDGPCASDPWVQAALAYVNASCGSGSRCPSWTIEPGVVPPGAGGYTDPNSCKIVVAPGHMNSCSVIAHELVHAGDFCRRGSYPDLQEGGYATNGEWCRASARTEARASFMSCCASDGTWAGCQRGQVSNCLKVMRDAYKRRLGALPQCQGMPDQDFYDAWSSGVSGQECSRWRSAVPPW